VEQLKQTDVKPLREKILKDNKFICPLCENPLAPCDSALDHCHSSGQIRNVICKTCNSLEGVFKSRWIRLGVAKKVPFDVFLRNLAEYLIAEPLPLLHPSCNPKPRKLMKSSYNKLKRDIDCYNKHLKKPIKMPEYPKSKRLTKRLKELFLQFGIDPMYYSKGTK